MNSLDHYSWITTLPFLGADDLVRLACVGNHTLHSKIRAALTEIELNPIRHSRAPYLDSTKYLAALKLVSAKHATRKLVVGRRFVNTDASEHTDWSHFAARLTTLEVRNSLFPHVGALLKASVDDMMTSLTLFCCPSPCLTLLPRSLTFLSIGSFDVPRVGDPNFLTFFPESLVTLNLGSSLRIYKPELGHLHRMSKLERLEIDLHFRLHDVDSWSFLPPSLRILKIATSEMKMLKEGETIASLLPQLRELKASADTVLKMNGFSADGPLPQNGGFPATLRRLDLGRIDTALLFQLLQCVGNQLECINHALTSPEEVAQLPFAASISYSLDSLPVSLLPHRLTALTCRTLSAEDMVILPSSLTILDCLIPEELLSKANLGCLPPQLTSLSLGLPPLLYGCLRELPAQLKSLDFKIGPNPHKLPTVPQDVSHLKLLKSLTCSTTKNFDTVLFDTASRLPPSISRLALNSAKTAIELFKEPGYCAEKLPLLVSLKMPIRSEEEYTLQLQLLAHLPPALHTLELGQVVWQSFTAKIAKALPSSLRTLSFYTTLDAPQSTGPLRFLPPYLTSLQGVHLPRGTELPPLLRL